MMTNNLIIQKFKIFGGVLKYQKAKKLDSTAKNPTQKSRN